MTEKKEKHWMTGKRHALKLEADRKTEFIKLNFTKADMAKIDAMRKSEKRTKWLRDLIFTHLTLGLCGAFYGWMLYLQA